MKKNAFVFAFLGIACPLYAHPPLAQPSLAPNEKRVKVSIEEATVDDALLQAAKAADFNIIADASGLKERPKSHFLANARPKAWQ